MAHSDFSHAQLEFIPKERCWLHKGDQISIGGRHSININKSRCLSSSLLTLERWGLQNPERLIYGCGIQVREDVGLKTCKTHTALRVFKSSYILTRSVGTAKYWTERISRAKGSWKTWELLARDHDPFIVEVAYASMPRAVDAVHQGNLQKLVSAVDGLCVMLVPQFHPP